MGKRLYVGSLPFDTTEEQLQQMFAACGEVASTKLIKDKFSGQSKGFGFVEMVNEPDAQAAITKLNGTQIGTRKITVNEARPMEDRGPGKGGGGFGGGQGGRGGGGGGGGRRDGGGRGGSGSRW